MIRDVGFCQPTEICIVLQRNGELHPPHCSDWFHYCDVKCTDSVQVIWRIHQFKSYSKKQISPGLKICDRSYWSRLYKSSPRKWGLSVRCDDMGPENLSLLLYSSSRWLSRYKVIRRERIINVAIFLKEKGYDYSTDHLYWSFLIYIYLNGTIYSTLLQENEIYIFDFGQKRNWEKIVLNCFLNYPMFCRISRWKIITHEIQMTLQNWYQVFRLDLGAKSSWQYIYRTNTTRRRTEIWIKLKQLKILLKNLQHTAELKSPTTTSW